MKHKDIKKFSLSVFQGPISLNQLLGNLSCNARQNAEKTAQCNRHCFAISLFCVALRKVELRSTFRNCGVNFIYTTVI